MAAGLTAPELRELSVDELASRLRESKEELFNLRFQVATGQLDNNRRLQTVRRDIARIYTIMRERELGLSVAADALKTKTRPRNRRAPAWPAAGTARSVRASSSATRWRRPSSSRSRTA